MSAAASMLIVSGLAPFICDLVGVVGGPLKQQINAMNSFTRPHTMAEVATRPPTLAQSLTRNWKNASLKTGDEVGILGYQGYLSLVTSTFRAEISYLKYIPGVPWDPWEWSIGLAWSFTLYWNVVFLPVKVATSVGTISTKYW